MPSSKPSQPEESIWPTPQVSDINGAADPTREDHRTQLRDVETGMGEVMWPTPSTTEIARDQNKLQTKDGGSPKVGERVYMKEGKHRQLNLSLAVNIEEVPEMWPTTRTTDMGDGSEAEVTPGGFRMTREKSGQSAGAKLGEAVNAMENWLTPTTAEAEKIGNCPNYGQVGLSNHPDIVGKPEREKRVKSGKKDWSTPITTDCAERETLEEWEAQRVKKEEEGINLHKPLWITVKLESGQSDGPQDPDSPSMTGKRQESWATPRTLDAHGLMMNTKKRGLQKESTLCGQTANQVKSRKLNPTWVESLMLLPAGYTQIELTDSEC
jgi:hypothetical protein